MTVGYAGEATVSCYSRALTLAEELGDAAQGQQIWGLWMAYVIAGDCDKSSDLRARLLRMSEEAGDRTFLAAAHYAAAITHEIVGNLAATKKHVEEVLRLDPPDSNRERVARWVVDPVISAGGVHLRVLALMGFSGPARDRWNAQRARLDQDGLDPRIWPRQIGGGVFHRTRKSGRSEVTRAAGARGGSVSGSAARVAHRVVPAMGNDVAGQDKRRVLQAEHGSVTETALHRGRARQYV